MDALFDWASTTNIFYCRTIFTVQARNCVPFLPCGRKNNSWRNTARGRQLSQGVPSSKKPHRGFFEFTPCGGISSGVFRRLRTATRDSVSGLCKPLKRLDLNFPFCSPWLFSGRGLQASLRVQSERSERLRELTPAARRRSERLRELTPAARTGA